ncbi:MAG: hypothetical protein DHS20C01_01490 [marine bacterium B5-7]|nr:MAG: hypothetical protein DHS20C01_01490 [marine bacterium B5-7]
MLLVLFSIELVYLVIANIVINADWLQARINQNPEHFEMTWGSAVTWMPGHVKATNVSFRSNTLRQQSKTDIGRINVWFSPLALLGKRFKSYRGSIDNITTKVRTARMVREAREEELNHFPVISGLDPVSRSSPEAYGPFLPGWRFELNQVRFNGDIDVAVGQFKIKANGYALGDVQYRIRDQLSAQIGVTNLQNILVYVNDESVLVDGTLSGTARIGAHIPYLYPGRSRAPFISVDVNLAGVLDRLDILNYYLRIDKLDDWPGFTVKGDFQGRMVIEDGSVQTATDVLLDATTFLFESNQFKAVGKGKIQLHPVHSKRDTIRFMTFELNGLKIFENRSQELFVDTRHIEVGFESPATHLDGPLQNIRTDVTITGSKVPSLSVFNRYIPESTRSSVVAGAGEMSLSLVFEHGVITGKVDINSDNLRLKVRNRETSASLALGLSLSADSEKHTFAIDGTTLRIDNFIGHDVTDGSTPVSANAQLNITKGSIKFKDPVTSRSVSKERLAHLVDFADGYLKLGGSISDISLIDYLMNDEAHIRFSGPGDFDADLVMKQGFIVHGSNAQFASGLLGVHFLDVIARGQGKLSASFFEQDSSRFLKIDTAIQSVSVIHDDKQTAFIQAPAIHSQITGRAPDVTEPLTDISFTLDIPEAQVPDITAYNVYLPSEKTMRLTSGVGQLSSHFDLSSNDSTGRIVLSATDIGAVFNGQPLSLDMSMNIDLVGEDVKQRTFSIDGSLVKFENIKYPNTNIQLQDWTTQFTFVDSILKWIQPIQLESKVNLAMTSTGPLVELFSGRYDTYRWIKDMLSVKNVTGSTHMRMRPGELVLNKVDIRGENLEVQANLKVTDDGAQGIVFNRLGVLGATVEFNGAKREWSLISAKKTFERHPGF